MTVVLLYAALFLFLAVSIAALAIYLNTLFSLIRDRVPFVGTPRWVIEWMRTELRVPPHAVVYDLGCGDGRVLRAMKRAYPDVTAIGYERNWWPCLLAWIRNRGSGVIVRRSSFYDADLRDADIVYLFLLTGVMPKVETLLRTQLKPGATVASYGFTFSGWEPAARIPNPKRQNGGKLNLYVVPSVLR